jgi:hypothetical protein
MQTIPCLLDTPRYTLDLTLSAAPYRLEFEFNERDGRWYLSMSTPENEQIIQGAPVVLGAPLLRGNNHPQRPPGTLIAIDTSLLDLDAGAADLGDRVQLVYVTADDLT